MATAIFFHGNNVFYIFVGALLVGIAVLAVFSFLLVRAFKRRLGRKAYFLAVVPFALAVLALYIEYLREMPNHGPPRSISPTQAARQIKSLPSYAKFSYSGAGFFNDKLYASSNIGLLEVTDGAITNVFQPQKEDSVVSGPWIDFANRRLWIKDDHTNELLNFDGSKWQRIPMPQPRQGYYTRGDVLEGIKPIATKEGFWIAAAGNVWIWDANTQVWRSIPLTQRTPKNQDRNEVIGVLAAQGKLLTIVRHEPLSYLVRRGESFQSDTIEGIDGIDGGSSGPIQQEQGYFAETWTVAGESSYICTQTGSLLRVTTEKISEVKVPGECENITTDGADLIASFRSKGVFRLKGDTWSQLATHPYPSGAGEYWVHLAANGGRIALAITAKPVIANRAPGDTSNIKFTTDAPTELWVANNGQFQKVELR